MRSCWHLRRSSSFIVMVLIGHHGLPLSFSSSSSCGSVLARCFQCTVIIVLIAARVGAKTEGNESCECVVMSVTVESDTEQSRRWGFLPLGA